MGFQVSPGVQVNEIDLTNVVPAVATSIGATAGAFEKGPVSSPVLITSEEELLRIFGKPQNTSNQFESWFTVANFLAYTDACYVTRAESTIQNAGATGGILIRDDDHYENSFSTGQGSVGEWAARTAGTHGNSLGVSICATATAYQQAFGANNQVNQADVAVGDTTITVDDVNASFAETTFNAATDVAGTNITISNHPYDTGDQVTYSDKGGTVITELATTQTFNAASDVSSEVISIADHGFVTGDQVTYSDEGGTAIAELTDGDPYFVIKLTDGTLSLSATDGGAAISLTDGPSENHKLTLLDATGTFTRTFFVTKVDADTVRLSLTDGGAVISLTDGPSENHGLTLVGGGGENQINVGDLISFYSDAGYTTPADNYREYEVTAVDTGTNELTIRLKDDPNGAGLQTAIADDAFILRRWKFYDLFDSAPGTSAWATANGRGTGDELHVVVYDTTGDITGYDNDVAGQRTSSVVETFSNLSKNSNAKSPQGDSIYYPDVIFRQSAFVYWMDHNASGTNWGTDTTSAYTAVDVPTLSPLSGGTDDYAVTAGEMQTAFEKYLDSDNIDVNLVLGGSSSLTTDSAAGQDTFVTMITNVVETRKDCVGFVSPYRSATVGVADSNTQTDNVTEAFDLCPSSSYMVFDSGYKYMYDKYNDVYRFVPMNGDTAGLCAYTDRVADAWFSPGGLNRGNVRNAIKLSYNPSKANRDFLYRARVNPIVNFPGQGVVLFGDKTALSKPSAFDRINVRRLFLVLEKAIATASKFQLFEFNDEFTRAQFRNLIEPFLRDVQGRRGITDFLVKCDATNNTGEVIDRNEFVADIFVKPARSINFITLNFIATRTGVAFSEVGG